MNSAKYSATEIFQALIDYETKKFGKTKIFLPTPEQILIIESDPANPSVVIAGAGSGKTETMGARVLWLVANGFVRPDEILGLTFTRKAAGELALRIRRRLRLLQKVNLLPAATSDNPMDLAVTVSTYHSYAGKILSEHGIRMGIDSGTDPMGQAATWQIINDIVSNFETTDYELTHGVNDIIKKVASLAGQIGEHASSTQAVREHALMQLEKLLTTTGRNDDVRLAITSLEEQISILPMVDQLDQYRRSNGTLSFDDQMSLAAELAVTFDEIGINERNKYRIVLLDEYQDTSFGQVRFLSHLFSGGHPVTAVGDPNQAIYGWRSASPETIGNFPRHFPSASGAPVVTYKLLTTFRNDEQVLKLANKMISEIAIAQGKPAAVDLLHLRNGGGPGLIKTALVPTAFEEAELIAEEISAIWNDPGRMLQAEADRSTCAVLVRSRSQIEDIEEALRAAGLPVEVLGLGGLIHLPEVADIIALLRILTFADAGSSMMRLLTGPRLALGPKDLVALGSFARSLVSDQNNSRGKSLEAVLVGDIDAGAMEAEDFPVGSIIEALETIEAAPVQKFSEVGFARLVKFSQELKKLRRNVNGSITDAIVEAEQFLHLDVEVLVRDGWEAGRANIDQFLDEAAKFSKSGGSLATFLRWLEIVDSEESGLKIESVQVSHSAVQILTIHQAKGAEWDCVVVPGLAKTKFPVSGKGLNIWTRNAGALPISLRGDSDQFIDFTYPNMDPPPKAATVKKALAVLEDNAKKMRLEEELRLAYVAFTRAKSFLLCTTSWFRTGGAAVDPSQLFFWAEEVAQELNPQAPIINCEKPDGNNPLKENPKSGIWPQRTQWQDFVTTDAATVRAACEIDIDQILAHPAELSQTRLSLLQDAQALLAEIQLRKLPAQVFLPSRLSVSTLIALAKNPDELAINIRRPMPNHIDKYARRGTAFHLWIEERFTSPVLFDDEVFFPDQPAPLDDIPLAELQEKWLASEWGNKVPFAVEVPFEMVLAGVLLRGRIDAVYKDGDRFQVVDWKTGREKSGDDLENAAIQLAMYRLAYAKLNNLDVKDIGAAFYYVGSDSTVAVADMLSERELIEIITTVGSE